MRAGRFSGHPLSRLSWMIFEAALTVAIALALWPAVMVRFRWVSDRKTVSRPSRTSISDTVRLNKFNELNGSLVS